jgi:hypothetical protein
MSVVHIFSFDSAAHELGATVVVAMEETADEIPMFSPSIDAAKRWGGKKIFL